MKIPLHCVRLPVFRSIGAISLAALLLLTVVWIYWPGISGPELLDDSSSVMVIGDLKEKPERAYDYVFGDKSGVLGRSVSMASFVLERLYLDEGLASSKQVNIVLHALNGGLVIWLFWLLFRYQRLVGYRALAVVLGALWLLHPLLVSTVLYVVQRMAMLAAFFMLLACISYVYWRLGVIAGRGGIWRFLPVPALFVIGLLAKENAIILLPLLLCMEALWFRFAGPGGSVVPWLRNTSYSLIGLGAVGLLSALVLQWDFLAGRFRYRPFTLTERLLTEARIVWDYVFQMVHPQVARMGLYHDDFPLSRSLFDPVVTLYAVLAWILVLLAMVVLLRWQGGRWIAFGIAWFLLGQTVESTVLPLELYFEHRNYFPSIGLLLVLGSLYAIVARKWPEPGKPLLAYFSLCALFLAALTSSQVQIWSNRSLLILNHVSGHPHSARANIDVAVELASKGEVEAAYRYSKRAFEASQEGASMVERHGDYEVRDLALSCIANKAPPAGAIDNLGKADPDRPLSSVSTLLTMVRLLQDKTCPEFDSLRFADRMAEIFLVDDYKRKGSDKIFFDLAVLENALQRYDKAYAYAQRFLALSPWDKRGLLMKLHFATALDKTSEAQDVIATLQRMDEQGKLTVGEQQTLALYLEN